MNRRNLLKAIPAAAALPAMAAVPALAQTETPVMRLFQEWEHLREVKATWGDDMPEAEYDAWLDRQIAVEDEIIITPATCAADWVMKIMAYTCLGESGVMDHHQNPNLWIEARALIAA